MRVTRAAEDPSIAFSPRPNFPRPRGNNKNRDVREMAKPARRLNLVALPSTGRPSGALTPRVASARLSPRRAPIFCQDTVRVDPRQYLTTPAGEVGEKLGYPIRPSKALPVGGFVTRPYTVPKRSESDQAKTDEEAQLWHLKRAMGSMRCFELQWGLVRAELEAVLAKHKKVAKIQLVEGAVAANTLQKNLKDLKESKVVFTQARSVKSGEAVGDLLHNLHENRAALVQRVNQLKASVMGALEEIEGVTIGHSQSSGNTKKLTEYMYQALDILNAMDAMVSQEGFATKSTRKSDLLNALGKLGRFAAATQQGFGGPVKGKNVLLKHES